MLEAQGSVLTNKYAEGYPGKRYYGGCEYVDIAEQLAIDRAKKLFGADYANVQPHSGSQANAAAYLALVQPGDPDPGDEPRSRRPPHPRRARSTSRASSSAPRQYGIRPDTGEIDYEQVQRLAEEHRPKMIIAGFSRLLARDRLGPLRADREERGRLLRGRHGACRGAGRGRASTPTRYRTPTSSRPPPTRRCADRAAA